MSLPCIVEDKYLEFANRLLASQQREVDAVVRELIEEQAMSYQNYCAWLTENQQMLLVAIARERLVSSPLSQQFIRTHNLPATSSVKTALKALVDKQLVGKTPQGYLVNDRFFAKWLIS